MKKPSRVESISRIALICLMWTLFTLGVFMVLEVEASTQKVFDKMASTNYIEQHENR